MEVWALYGIVAIVAMLLSGLVGTVEAAVSSISRARVENMVKDEVRGAPGLLRVLNYRANHINLLVMIKTILDATAAVFAAMMTMDLISSDAWAITAAIAAVTLLTFGVVGTFSRTVGKRNPYSVSLHSAQVLAVINRIMGPLSKLLIWIGNLISPGHGFRDGPYATEVELREMVDIAQEHGIVEVTERRMIQNIFDLASTFAKNVMVPRPEMIWLEADKSAGQATNLMIRSGHSRVPIIGENVDDIIGVAYLKDIVAETYHRTDGGRGVPVADIVRAPFFVPESKPLDELLHEMQRDNTHMALLVDEYGGIAGLVTMEDILEEIVGEITDEYDESEVAPIEEIAPRQYRAVARLSLEDLVEFLDDHLGFELEFDDDTVGQVDTVAGLISYGLGRVPLPGSHVDIEGVRFTAEGGRDRRGRMKVRSVLVDVPALAESEGDDQGEK
ncbi:hemolysin family protein [Corynebacterium breve]|uniref:Hemolysin family protein n=1 Tax=Corynebacterium breve TaxID=3049799 RepID=A0ABY8VCC7_9CORY|nr:hemolysin family protein [Corynebacterium breve]WIM67094.1 hemolysin family protein [Corynebacterium breve]